ncbi:MAG: hypothetical protein SFU55_11165 [Methylophilus sp.]|nr:hypothetical protein [Methylophilus sp.]
MRLLLFVIFPTLLQLIIGLFVMFSHKHGGEFVGLSVMLLGMIAIPITTIINWSRIKVQPPISAITLITRTFWTTLIFPILCIALYIMAS